MITENSLNAVRAALEKAQLPDVTWCTHAQHLTVLSPVADLVVWAVELGDSVVFKVEGNQQSHRAGSIKQLVETLRRITAP